MEKITITFIFGMLLLIIMVACTEKIDIDLDDTFTRLVVEGAITNTEGPHSVTLSYSTDYYSNQAQLMVEGATVVLSDGSDIWQLSENEPGIYQTEADFMGEAGKTYSLFIDDVYINEEKKSFEASCYMNNVADVDSIQVEWEPRWESWVVKVYALDPPSQDFYMFNVFNGDIKLSDTIDQVFVTSDILFNGNYTYGIISQVFAEKKADIGDTIVFEMAGITKEYYDFIWKVQEETGFNAPLFSGPPANVPGNISNGGIGFFAAYSVSYSSRVIDKK